METKNRIRQQAIDILKERENDIKVVQKGPNTAATYELTVGPISGVDAAFELRDALRVPNARVNLRVSNVELGSDEVEVVCTHDETTEYSRPVNLRQEERPSTHMVGQLAADLAKEGVAFDGDHLFRPAARAHN
jgi:hypothetical protein